MNTHCSQWDGIDQSKLKDNHRLHIEVLVRALGTGPWNIPTNWSKVEFGHYYTRFALNQSFATADFDALTRLVLAAHEKAVRVEVSPCNFHYLNVTMWSREPHVEGMGFHKGHPSIEQAIERFNPTPKDTTA